MLEKRGSGTNRRRYMNKAIHNNNESFKIRTKPTHKTKRGKHSSVIKS